MEEIVTELREDKKRAWEVISCLNERLSKAEKQGKDEQLHNTVEKILERLGKQDELQKKLDILAGKDDDLHNKMDRILEKMENKTELEQKVDYLKDELEKSQRHIANLVEYHKELKDTMKTFTGKIEHLAEDVTKSKEMLKVIDTAETAVGYAELLVKDFDKIHGKMSEMHLKIEDARQLDHGIFGKIDELKSQILKACQLEHVQEAIHREVKRMKDEIKGNTEVIPKILQEIQKGNENMNTLSELKRQCETISTALVSQKVDIDQLKRELAKTAKKPKATYKCFNSNCHSELPKHLVLRKDGVSVQCPNLECRQPNIIDKLEEGHKWMGIHCINEWHYQQFPLSKTANVTETCGICGKQGCISDEKRMAILAFENTDADLRKNIGASQFVKTTKKINSELKNKCRNSNCCFIFPKDIKLREDGVSVQCPDDACRSFNIVGSLKVGNRWGFMTCNGKNHFQQIPRKTKSGEKQKCVICEKDGEVSYADTCAAVRE